MHTPLITILLLALPLRIFACTALKDSGNASMNSDRLSSCLDAGSTTLISGIFPVDRGVIIDSDIANVEFAGLHGDLCGDSSRVCRDQLRYVGAVTTTPLLVVKDAGSHIQNLWINANGRVGALTGEAVVVQLGAVGVVVEHCKLTGATFPSPFVWQTGTTREWIASQPRLADSAAPGPAFADAKAKTISLGSQCTVGQAGCYGSASAAAQDPLTSGYSLTGTDLVAATVDLFTSGKAEPILEDDSARNISWGYANAGGKAPLGTVVVSGSGFLLADSFVGHALQGFNLCGAKDVILRRNQLGLTGCDTIVLCGTATNLTIADNTFCGAGYYCPNARGVRSQNMVGLYDLSADAVPKSLLRYIPAAGIFGGYPQIQLFGVEITGNDFSDGSCARWPVGPSFGACGNGLDLTGVNTLGLGKAGTKLYWGPLTFADSSAKQCYPANCKLGTAGCFDSPAHCVASTRFIAPAFGDAGTKSCAPRACAVGRDEGCYGSLSACIAGNPSFTDVTRLRFLVSNNTLKKSSGHHRHTCPVGDPAPPTLCSSCDGAYPVDVWKGYNKFACTFEGNYIDWAGHKDVYVHY